MLSKFSNSRKPVSEYYKEISEITGLPIEEVKRIIEFTFNTIKLLVKSGFKKRIHIRGLINIDRDKKKIAKLEEKGFFEKHEDLKNIL